MNAGHGPHYTHGETMYENRIPIARPLSSLGVLALVVLAACSVTHTGKHRTPAVEPYLDVIREAAPGLPGYTVYRPAGLEASPGRSPVVVWSNGACSASNDDHLYFLTQVAAHGFVVIAYGAPDAHSSPGSTANENRLRDAIDWAFSPPDEGGPTYFNRLDEAKIATAGHSCGGIDALWTASNDERVQAVVSMNSGCFPNSGTGGLSGPLAVCRDDLQSLRGPALFIAGGPSDVAYDNSKENYEVLSTVPTAFASHATAGHDGFFGSASRTVQLQAVRAVVEWLDGSLNANEAAFGYLVGPDAALAREPGWTVLSKGF